MGVPTSLPSDWVTAYIDAHIKLKFSSTETWVGGLDVADGGNDRNALAMRKGSVLLGLTEFISLLETSA
jgi:phage terminase large subunit